MRNEKVYLCGFVFIMIFLCIPKYEIGDSYVLPRT